MRLHSTNKAAEQSWGRAESRFNNFLDLKLSSAMLFNKQICGKEGGGFCVDIYTLKLFTRLFFNVNGKYITLRSNTTCAIRSNIITFMAIIFFQDSRYLFGWNSSIVPWMLQRFHSLELQRSFVWNEKTFTSLVSIRHVHYVQL